MSQDIHQLLANAEQVGVIGSPSATTELTLDILGTAASRKLVGELAMVPFYQDSAPAYALGQITEVRLRNIWHEDPTMRSLIRQRGRVDPISERQDTHTARMTISAVFRSAGNHQYEQSILGTVPPTGTPIYTVTDDILDTVLHAYKNQLFYLGRVYGSHPKLPMWFKHFDSGPNGAGEAYHIGIFGKTGSGKSVLAKMILLAYAHHPQVGILIIDPQGEFARDIVSGPSISDFPLPLKELLKGMGRKIGVISVQKLVLDRWELFAEILYQLSFFEQLSIPKGENRRIAIDLLIEKLKKKKIRLDSLSRRTAFEEVMKIFMDKKNQTIIYRSEISRNRFSQRLIEVDRDDLYQNHWMPFANLFAKRSNSKTVEEILKILLQPAQPGQPRPVIILNLSRESALQSNLFWNDDIQALVIKRLLEGLTHAAESAYQQNQSLNTLVMIDEAHRLAPRHIPHEEEFRKSIRNILIDAARTTRKYGLGWLFISQTLYSIHPEIFGQMRIYFFGFGLGLGQEFQTLKQIVGSSGPALELYALFRDPHSSFDRSSRQYSFMSVGPVSPLSFAGTPLFFNAFTSVNEFLNVNRLNRHLKKS